MMVGYKHQMHYVTFFKILSWHFLDIIHMLNIMLWKNIYFFKLLHTIHLTSKVNNPMHSIHQSLNIKINQINNLRLLSCFILCFIENISRWSNYHNLLKSKYTWRKETDELCHQRENFVYPPGSLWIFKTFSLHLSSRNGLNLLWATLM